MVKTTQHDEAGTTLGDFLVTHTEQSDDGCGKEAAGIHRGLFFALSEEARLLLKWHGP